MVWVSPPLNLHSYNDKVPFIGPHYLPKFWGKKPIAPTKETLTNQQWHSEMFVVSLWYLKQHQKKWQTKPFLKQSWNHIKSHLIPSFHSVFPCNFWNTRQKRHIMTPKQLSNITKNGNLIRFCVVSGHFSVVSLSKSDKFFKRGTTALQTAVLN